MRWILSQSLFRGDLLLGVIVALLISPSSAVNFPFETVQLTDGDIGNFSAIAFGNTSAAPSPSTPGDCRAFPGTPAWPTGDEWTRLDASLGSDGGLLRPLPPGAACYDGPQRDARQCQFLLFGAFGSRFYIDDPLTVLTTWPQGDTCQPSLLPQGNCTQGGFPVYVVNATTVRHIQAAVNFARNRNLRLVIKNTGHDFIGRSTGAGSLSIWTHYLKQFEFLTDYQAAGGVYRGPAARVGAGLEAWELYAYMDRYNMTLVVPGGSTVGAYGGWSSGGGHSTLASSFGLGSDQLLSLEVVTADGRFLTADPETNADLFYALRGGGPGTYGVVTSAVVKAFPPVFVAETSISFSAFTPGAATNLTGALFNFTNPLLNGTNPFYPFNITNPFGIFNGTNPFNLTFPPSFNFTHPSNGTFRPFNGSNFQPPVILNNTATFWRGVNAYFAFGKKLCDAGGSGYSYISGANNAGFTFTTNVELPGMSTQEAFQFLQPLFERLNQAGVPVNNTTPVTSLSWGPSRQGEGDSPGSGRFGTRLFPRENWDDVDSGEGGPKFAAMMAAIRGSIEDGYTFHGVQVAPSEKTAGYPGTNSSVNPAFRRALMHGDLFDRGPYLWSAGGATTAAAARKAARARFTSWMDRFRAVSPGAGAYINEADAEEPNWQQSFFGDNYARLLQIKRDRDPWGVFWAPNTVGSETWEVRTADGALTQNGPLCRAATGS